MPHTTLKDKTIGFIGAGNMASALIRGITGSGLVSPGSIMVTDIDKERLVNIAEEFGVEAHNLASGVVKNSDIVILAVKPKDLGEVITDISGDLTGDEVLVSIIAGKTTDHIREALKDAGLNHPITIIRTMPNTPALVGAGAIGIFAPEDASKDDLTAVSSIFEAVGTVKVVDDESLIDVVTGLSGSGPAYIFLIMKAMTEAGAKLGLSAEVSKALALQTTLGAATLATGIDKSLDELITMVSSPGGTTIEGLKALKDGSIEKTIGAAVEAATRRSKEISEENSE